MVDDSLVERLKKLIAVLSSFLQKPTPINIEENNADID
jgi:hypothetical protein